MSDYDTVLFDLDGTILNSIELILDSYRHTLSAHGLPPRTDDDVLSGLGQTLEDQFVRWFGATAPVEALIATYVAHNLENHDRLTSPYPGVTELIHRLDARGVPMAIVTSKRRQGALRGLERLDLRAAFRVVVGADDVTRHKPDPAPVLLALERLGRSAGRGVVFVGDATHDLHAGRAAGVSTIAVTWGAADREALAAAHPDHLVDTADELARLLG
ncbi:MAG: HAD family hydrolase [Sandaracinaceae bacterium]